MIDDAVRAHIRAAVASRSPVDEREARSIPAFLEHFDRLRDPLSETADDVHVTGSAILVGRRGVVLHRHKRLGLWLQPGGHIEAGELPWEGALREAAEETGLGGRHPADGVRFVHVDVHPGPRGHTHLDLRYLVVGPDAEPAPPADESPETYWFSWADAIAKADEGLRGALVALAPGCTFTVRRATRHDAAAVAEVYLRSRKFGLGSVQNAHTDDEIRAWIASHLIAETEVWVGLNGDGEVVGMMGLAPPALAGAAAFAGTSTSEDPPMFAADRPLAFLAHLYVDPSVIGMGLGEQLLDIAKQRFPAGLELWAFQVNEAAQRFYVRHGFVEVQRTDGRANEERQPDLRMVWH